MKIYKLTEERIIPAANFDKDALYISYEGLILIGTGDDSQPLQQVALPSHFFRQDAFDRGINIEFLFRTPSLIKLCYKLVRNFIAKRNENLKRYQEEDSVQQNLNFKDVGVIDE